MNATLGDRLTVLFDRAAGAVELTEQPERARRGDTLEPQRVVPRGRVWAVAAAAVLVVVAGVAGVVRVVDRSPDDSVSEAPVDPGPLYVLPQDVDEWVPGNGSTSSGSAGSYEGIVVGIPDGDMFIDPVAVSLSPDPPDGFSFDTWPALSVEGGPAFMSPDDGTGLVVVTQHRGTVWLTSTSFDRVVSPIVRAFEAVEVDASGTFSLHSPELAVIETYDISSTSTGHGTYAEVRGPGVEYVVVETLSGEIPLLAILTGRADHVEAATVNGEAAWHASGVDADGEWHAIAWEFARRQSVLVSDHASYDTLLALAEDLEVVDEATWRAATGAS